jgi:hypothetical protein
MTDLSTLGSITVKEMETATVNVGTSVATTDVRSSSYMNVTAEDDVTISSTAGRVVLQASGIDVTSDLAVQGVIYDATSDGLKVGSKNISLNVRSDASDANASGAGIRVCGDAYAEHLNTGGVSGNPAAISALWSSADGGLWTLTGGHLAFTKTLSNGDECVFTFRILDSGDLVLNRKIGTQSAQALAYWQNV